MILLYLTQLHNILIAVFGVLFTLDLYMKEVKLKMITINNAILHILDLNSGVTVFSEQELDIQNKSVVTFLTRHIERSFNDSNMKSGDFKADSKFKGQMARYIDGNLDFINFSLYIADTMNSYISKSDKLDPIDLIVCDFNTGDVRSIGILECVNKTGYTHQVIKSNGKVYNDIINYYTILPNVSQKLDEYAFIDVKSQSIKFSDKKRCIDGEDVFILPDIILECSSSISPKAAIKLVNSIMREVAENNGQNSAFAVSKAKSFILENTEVSDNLEPIKLGKKVFGSSPIIWNFRQK